MFNSTPHPNEFNEVQEFLRQVSHCSNGDPTFIIEAIPNDLQSVDARNLLEILLTSGVVDKAIKEVDSYYEWFNYKFYDEETDKFDFREGTFYNPEVPISMVELSYKELFDLFHWLKQTPGTYTKDTPKPNTTNTLNKMFQSLLSNDERYQFDTGWSFYLIDDNIFYGIDSEVVTPEGNLAYFENDGDNLFIFGKSSEHYLLFLLNAYPGYSESHPLIGRFPRQET